MRDEKNSLLVFFPLFQQPLPHGKPCQIVQRGKRLVQKEQVRPCHQSPGKRSPLPHSARELTGQFIPPSLQADILQGLCGALVHLRFPHAAPQFQWQTDIFRHRSPGKQHILLGHITAAYIFFFPASGGFVLPVSFLSLGTAFPGFSQFCGTAFTVFFRSLRTPALSRIFRVFGKSLHSPFKGFIEPVQKAENCAFPAAGWSDQGDKLPPPDGKIQIFDQCQLLPGIAEGHVPESSGRGRRTVCLYHLNCCSAHFLFSQAMSQKAPS